MSIPRFLCDFCSLHFASTKEAGDHEENCVFNPALKKCGSCASFVRGYCVCLITCDESPPSGSCGKWEEREGK